MVYKFPADIQSLIETLLASGRYRETDDVIREALRALSHETEDSAALREGIARWQAGDEGLPVDEAFDEIRRKIYADDPK